MKKAATEQSGAFEEEVGVVLGRLRGALAELLAALPGNVSKGPDLRRVVKLDNKLCWKVVKVATAGNPLAAAIHVPSPTNMKSLLKAASARKVPRDRREAVAQAAADFEKLVKDHAGDRASFDSMVSAYGDDPAAIDLTHKRAAFRANSHICGMQAETQLNCCFLHPAQDPGMLDIATLRGGLNLRRMRPDATWIVAEARTADNDGVVRREIVREPLDPSQETTHGLAPLRAFCSEPLPRFSTVGGQGGFVLGELAGNRVGNASAITCITADVIRNAASCYQDEHNTHGELVAGVHTPCHVLIHDVLIFKGMFGPISPEVCVYDDYWRKMSRGATVPEAVTLATREVVSCLGRGPSVLPTPDVPRYAEMARYAFARLGWDGEQFEVYRCRVEYPVMHSAVVVRFPLPKAPTI